MRRAFVAFPLVLWSGRPATQSGAATSAAGIGFFSLQYGRDRGCRQSTHTAAAAPLVALPPTPTPRTWYQTHNRRHTQRSRLTGSTWHRYPCVVKANVRARIRRTIPKGVAARSGTRKKPSLDGDRQQGTASSCVVKFAQPNHRLWRCWHSPRRWHVRRPVR